MIPHDYLKIKLRIVDGFSFAKVILDKLGACKLWQYDSRAPGSIYRRADPIPRAIRPAPFDVLLVYRSKRGKLRRVDPKVLRDRFRSYLKRAS
jgi:hypothetical protein